MLILVPEAQGRAIVSQERMVRTLLLESANQKPEVIYAIACTFRNRLDGGMSLGSTAIHRSDGVSFAKKQPRHIRHLASRVYLDVFIHRIADTSNGATHFENVKQFGRPSWARDMVITKKIGNIVFYKRKKR